MSPLRGTVPLEPISPNVKITEPVVILLSKSASFFFHYNRFLLLLPVGVV